jgi:hypothetical protein
MTPPETGSPAYDAFISYSHLDRSWVEASLVGPLERAGVRVLIDSSHFVVGAPIVVNMERAVECSRHTLLVLTPEWVKSEWTGFEGMLALALDPAGRRRRLIPLLLRPCEPPLWLRNLSYADFTDPAHYEAQLARVIQSLSPEGVPTLLNTMPAAAPSTAEPVLGEPVREGVEALGRLMQEPAVRAAAVSFDTLFRDAGARIDLLASYKDVHDLLHTMQVQFLDQAVQEARGFPDDELACENLANHALTLQGLVSGLQDIAARQLLPRSDVSWIETDLTRAVQDLQVALDARSSQGLSTVTWTIRRLLATRPSLINTRLNEAARSLNLTALRDALAAVVEEARRSSLDRQKVGTFDAGVAALGDLAVNLGSLVDQHDRWQMLDVDLRPLAGGQQPPVEELTYAWAAIRDQLTALTAHTTDDWASVLLRQARAFDDVLASGEQARLRPALRRVNRLVTDRFYRVDLLLKRQCDELRKVCDPLAAVLRILE